MRSASGTLPRAEKREKEEAWSRRLRSKQAAAQAAQWLWFARHAEIAMSTGHMWGVALADSHMESTELSGRSWQDSRSKTSTQSKISSVHLAAMAQAISTSNDSDTQNFFTRAALNGLLLINSPAGHILALFSGCSL